MAKIYSDEHVLLFAASYADCISDFSESRKQFVATLPADQQKLFIGEFERLKLKNPNLNGKDSI